MAPAPQFDTRERARRFLIALSLILVVITFTSAFVGLRGTEGQFRQLAIEMSRSFYNAVNAMREWNFSQGGVYVRLTGGTVPNSYLKDPLREVETTTGLKLTLINHSQMTRLLAELLQNQKGVHLHLTSLTPLRPENKPDAWETRALQLFEQGSNEESTVVTEAGGSTFRYMAPLRTNDSCLPCHNTPLEMSHPVRGGISIAFSYDWFTMALAGERRRILFVHGAFLILGLSLILVTGKRLMKSIQALQESLATIKRLEGFLPICASCKKIRTAGADHRLQASWVGIESYIEARTDAEFTHGLCPECSRKLYPDLFVNSEF